MDAEIDSIATPVPVRILGVNAAFFESGNAGLVSGREIPWLQDDAADVWGLWGITSRDVVVIDADNRVTAIYNLSSNTLADPGNYAELRALILDATGM